MGLDLGIGEIALGLSAASAAAGAVGAVSSAASQSADAKYQAQVARNDQRIATQNAQYASQAGAAAATRAGLRGRAAAGALAAGLAASGIDANTGSASEARQTQGELQQLDTETTRQDAALRSYGFRTQASNYGAAATLDTARAKSASTAGAIGAGASLLGGAASIADKWVRYQDAGLLPGD